MYGVEEYVAECLRSILQDPMEDMEVIVVNDCTKDSSARIAAEFAHFDGRLRVIDHEVNRGLGAARNTGLYQARGEYVTFPDSDDIVVPGAYARMIKSLDISGSDFVSGPAEEFGAKRKRYWTTNSPVFEEDRSAVDPDEYPDLIEDHTAWNKVFRRAFLIDNHIEWPVGVKCEDVVPSARAYAAAATVDVVSDVVYLYRRRRDSITTALGSESAFADWVGQSLEALRAISGAAGGVRSRLAQKILLREYQSSVRLSAVAEAGREVRENLGKLAELGCQYLTSVEATSASAEDRLRVGLTAGRRFDEFERWSDRTAQARRDDLESAIALVPAGLRRLLGFGAVDFVGDSVAVPEVARRKSSHGLGLAPELSVVIPAHNVAEYLDETLRSVLSAEGADIEVIVVDDWSSDGTWEIAASHAERDARVRAFRAVGRGGGQARNLGVELARGRFLAFADGDDVIPRHAYRQMLHVARVSGAQMVTAKHLRVYSDSTWDPTDRLYPLVGTIVDTSVGEYPSLIHPRTIWNRVFSREFWDKSVAPFCGGPRANDIVPYTTAALSAERIAYVPVFSYLYRSRPGRGSMTAKLGDPPSVVSYLSEEATCAELINLSGMSGLIDTYWQTVLAEDGWGNLSRYLISQSERAFEDLSVSPCVGRLLKLVPEEAYRRVSPEQQAVWSLVAHGYTRSAYAIVRAMRKHGTISADQSIEVANSVCAVGGFSSKTLDFVLWKYLVRRLIDDRGSITLAQAEAAIEVFQRSGRLRAIVAAPGTVEDSVLRVARAGRPDGLLRIGARTPAHGKVDIRVESDALYLSGESAQDAVGYRWLFLRSPGRTEHIRRVPIALAQLNRDARRWASRVPFSSLEVQGHWEIWCSYEDHAGVHADRLDLTVEGGRLVSGAKVLYEDALRVARRAAMSQRWADAVSALEGKWTAGVASVEELTLLGRAYRKVGRFGDAAAVLKRAVEVCPDDGELRSQARRGALRATYHRLPLHAIPLPAPLSRVLN